MFKILVSSSNKPFSVCFDDFRDNSMSRWQLTWQGVYGYRRAASVMLQCLPYLFVIPRQPLGLTPLHLSPPTTCYSVKANPQSQWLHACRRYEPGAIRCSVHVDVVMPVCGHRLTVPCHMRDRYLSEPGLCSESVSVFMPLCGHELQVNTHRSLRLPDGPLTSLS